MPRNASTFVVSITPFRADGALDEDGLRGHLARQRDAGVGVYLAGSGSGEGYTLDPRRDAPRRSRSASRSWAGTSRSGPWASSRAPPTRRSPAPGVAATVGVDAFQLYSLDQGHGNRPTPAELDRYVRTVLDGVDAARRALYPPERRLPPPRRAARGRCSTTATR